MSLTVADRVMLHMGRFEGIQFDQYGMPYELTEAGIGSCIGKSRAHVSIELKKLQERDLVRWENAHVNGSSKKMKTFYLTLKGQMMLGTLRDKMIDEGLTLDDISYERLDGEKKPIPEMEMAYRMLYDATEKMFELKGENNPNVNYVVDKLIDTVRLLAFTKMREN